tara:strand:- start:1352 stop:1585 length:234 start_codon:yes stop_codon:yes gene_type:complete
MDRKSILIGALGASLLFLTLGAGINEDENEVGTYQGFATDEQQYIINTKTGEIYTLGIIQPVKASWNKKSKDKPFRD